VLVRLLLLFITVPLIELVLLLWLADFTAWWVAILLVIVTGVVGSLLARSQGFRTYLQIQRELAGGRMPTESLVDAMMIFVAGALLLTPGMLTDVVGLSLLLPFGRRFYRRRLIRWFKSHFSVHVSSTGPDGSTQWTSGESRVIDSFVVESPKQKSEDHS